MTEEKKHFFLSWGIFVAHDVRMRFYGRDNLVGYDTLKDWAVEPYRGQAFATKRTNGVISGALLELTQRELDETDDLEQASGYKRIWITTDKGYVAALYVRDEALRP